MKKICFYIFFCKLAFAFNVEVSDTTLMKNFLSNSPNIFNEKYGGKRIKIIGIPRDLTKFGKKSHSGSRLFCFSISENEYVPQKWANLDSDIDPSNCVCTDNKKNYQYSGSYEECLYAKSGLDKMSVPNLKERIESNKTKVDTGFIKFIGSIEYHGKASDLNFVKLQRYSGSNTKIKIECTCDSIFYNLKESTSKSISKYNNQDESIDTLHFFDFSDFSDVQYENLEATNTVGEPPSRMSGPGFQSIGTSLKLRDCKFIKIIQPYDKYPTVKRMGNPKYPDICRSAGIQGKVTVKFTIDEDGIVIPSSVKLSKSIPCLDKEVIHVIKRSRWNPAQLNGKEVEASFVKSFIFSLNQ